VPGKRLGDDHLLVRGLIDRNPGPARFKLTSLDRDVLAALVSHRWTNMMGDLSKPRLRTVVHHAGLFAAWAFVVWLGLDSAVFVSKSTETK
jgi:hypothetical protein